MSSYLRAAATCVGNACMSVSNSYGLIRKKALKAYNRLPPADKEKYLTIHNILLRSNLSDSEKERIRKTGAIDYSTLTRITEEQNDLRIPLAERIINNLDDRTLFLSAQMEFDRIMQSDLIINKPDIADLILSPDPVEQILSGAYSAYGAINSRLGTPATREFRERYGLPTNVRKRVLGTVGIKTNTNHLAPFRNNAPPPTGGSRKKKRTVKKKRTQRRR